MVTSLTMGIIEADINAALRSIKAYKENNRKYEKNISAYHIQQAVEKLIKIQVYAKVCGSHVNQGLYTHNIDKLISFCRMYNIQCIIPRYVVDNSARISEWEVRGRYDFHFSVNIKTLESALEVTIDWYRKLKKMGFR